LAVISEWWLFVRRLVHALVIVVTLVIGATVAAGIVSQTAWFKNWLRGYIEREANLYLNGRISIERLGGNLFSGIELENIGLSMDGTEVAAVKDVGLDYSVFELIAKGLSVNSLRLNQPVLHLRREGDTWSISRLVKKQRQEADRQGPNRPITIEDIGISDASILIDGPIGTSGVEIPKRIDHLDAKLSFKYEPVRYSIEIAHVSFRGSEPPIGLNALSGGIAVKDDTAYVNKLALRTEESSISIDGAVQHYLTRPVFNLQITSDRLSLPEIARVVPALASVRLQPAFELKLDGPVDRLGIDMNVRSAAGQVTGRLVADLLAPDGSVRGVVSIRHLDLAPILEDRRPHSDITADAYADVHGTTFSNFGSLRGTIRLEAPRIVVAGYVAERIKVGGRIEGRRVALNGRASAYGAAATVTGRVTLPERADSALAYDVHGRAQNVDLRRLPRELRIPPADTNVNADYHLVGSVTIGSTAPGPGASGGSRFGRTDGEARFAASTLAGARVAPGSTVEFSMNGNQISYRADASVTDVDLQRIGRALNVPALAADRYKSSINGHVTASGSGTTPAERELTTAGTLTDSTVLGGHIPQLVFDADLAGDTGHVKAAGSFAGFDPSVASNKPTLKNEISGSIDVDATVRRLSVGITAEGVEATARIQLQPSTIGGLAIDHAQLDGDYHDSTGDIRALEIVGRDINVRASGRLALDETGQSKLTFHADTPRLDEIGKLVDRPLTGIAKVDGTITGNKRELQASGTVIGDGVRHGDNGALALSANYTAVVPDLTFADTRVSANTSATFVTLAGQHINELAAKTDYRQNQIDFDLTAKQPQRSLAAAGSLLMQPDLQEVRLQRLTLQTQGTSWQVGPGPRPAIRYADNAVGVKDFVLVSANGDQQITADGAFGHPGDALTVTLTNLDLAGVDALLLRPPQFFGRLNATGTIGGTKDAPLVKGDFRINQGRFRQFGYDTLGGTVDCRRKGLTLDATLQQNPHAWVTAKGFVPTALFTALGTAAGHEEPATDADRVDVRIDSSPIDLGIMQGFTTALTNVKGVAQANLHVTGSAADPHPDGVITVQNGSFRVEPTGVVYTGLDASIMLQSDRLHIDEIRVLDDRRKSLSIIGDLAIHELAVGGMNVMVKADDFKVIDNKMGRVRVKSNLRIEGELRYPRLEGDLGVATGQINLDPILAAIGPSAYATTQTEYATGAADQNGQTRTPSAFEALQMTVHVTVPDDLVVKGSDLNPGNAPVGLGAVNVTLGGDLWASKVPWDQVRLVGGVNTVRGTYDFQGRRFEILRDGIVRFEGLDVLDPSLDITTRRIIQAVDARANLRGTLKRPEIVLTSTPPLEQADILALIVFNQPINQLGEGQQISLMQRAQALASGAVAGQLARSIGDALHFDTFDIQIAPESGAAAQLTLGQQVGPNLFLKIEEGIGDVSTTNVVLEYQLNKWLRLQSNLLQGASTQQQLFQRMQGSGVDLLLFFSY
jgi:autotransporter translocation and assembly factor TamB